MIKEGLKMAVKKTKAKYICSECGYSSLKWLGKCPNCDSWGTFEEEIDNALIEGYSQSQDLFGALLNNDSFKKRLANIFIDDVFKSLKGSQE